MRADYRHLRAGTWYEREVGSPSLPALALLVAVTAAFLLLIQWLTGDTTTIWLIGEVRWLDELLSGTGLLLMLFLSVVLMVIGYRSSDFVFVSTPCVRG